jgi:formylglycine-generating enzyme
MKRRASLWVPSLALMLTHCTTQLEPDPSVQFAIVTNAPTPYEDAAPNAYATRAIPLVSRLEISVFAAGADAPCQECTRVFAVTDSDLQRGSVSFGLPTAQATLPLRLRFRLFRGEVTSQPRSRSTIEKTIAVTSGEQTRAAVVALDVEGFGAPQGTLDAPLPEAQWGVRGTFGDAVRTVCTRATVEGASCVPGGTFWRGIHSAIHRTSAW